MSKRSASRAVLYAMPSAESRVSAFYCRVHVSAYHFSQLCPETMQKPGLHDEPKSLFPSVYTQTDGINTTSLAVKKKPKKPPGRCRAYAMPFLEHSQKKKEEEKKAESHGLCFLKIAAPRLKQSPTGGEPFQPCHPSHHLCTLLLGLRKHGV